MVVVAASEVTRPMSYAADQAAPPLPAVMVPRGVGARLSGALAARRGVRLRLRVMAMEMAEEEEVGLGVHALPCPCPYPYPSP